MKVKELKINVPRSWRKGQTLFNFLEWLATDKGISPNQTLRIADTFQISDEELDKYIEEYENL
jgi:hypothetical protein